MLRESPTAAPGEERLERRSFRRPPPGPGGRRGRGRGRDENDGKASPEGERRRPPEGDEDEWRSERKSHLYLGRRSYPRRVSLLREAPRAEAASVLETPPHHRLASPKDERRRPPEAKRPARLI